MRADRLVAILLKVQARGRITAAAVDAQVRRPEGFDLPAFWATWESEYAAGLPTFTTRVRLGPLARRFATALGALAPRAVFAEETDVARRRLGAANAPLRRPADRPGRAAGALARGRDPGAGRAT